MRKIALWEAEHPKKVLVIALLLIIPAFLGFIFTGVNYDIMSYLPDDLEAVQGEDIMDETFHTAGISIVIAENSSPKETVALKNKIENVEGVASVIWVDTLADIDIPADILPDEIKDVFYSKDESKTMMLVRYETGEEGSELAAIGNIKKLLDEQTVISGVSVIVDDTKDIADKQAPIYIAVAVALALSVMALMMESWLQPMVILFALGIAVIYNMGTNFFMGKISFVTQCVAAILQLGITMDYSIFLIDRYAEEKPKFARREDAMAEAVVKSFSALMGSSLTTVFGFLALCFMKLKLGFDIGFVMAKGVVFGILTVVFVLPAILMLFEGLMLKYKHRTFVPRFDGINRFSLKNRKLMAIVFVILLLPTFFLQRNVEKYYSMDRALPDYLVSIRGLHTMKEDFGMASTHFVVVDDSIPAQKLIDMEKELEKLPGISSVLAYNTIVGPAISDDIIPDEVLELCKQGGMQLIMLNSEYSPATAELTQQLKDMDKIIKACDPNAYITGEGAITQGMMDTTDVDFAVTAVLSIAAIFILIAIVFKSWTLPIILVLSIELAIWINLSVSTIMGTQVSFVDPTCVNCIQLGATVDYAILLTTRFREELIKNPLERDRAISVAADAAMSSIVQSAAVFFVTTFGLYLVCDINIVRGMCLLLARGAIISACVISLFLSPVLRCCEGLIRKTTPTWLIKGKEEA